MDPLQSSSVRDDPENTMELQPIFLPGKRKSEIPISPANLPSQNKRATPGHFKNIDHEFKEAIGTFHRFCKAREEQQQQEEDGTLQGFRQMIISTISNMSEAKQAKAILRVTEAVMQIKMEPED